MVDTSTRGTLPARLAGQRSTNGSEATSGEGGRSPTGWGEGYYDPPPITCRVPKFSKNGPQPYSPKG